MNQPTADSTIEVLAAYSSIDAAHIGRLMHNLSDKFSDEPIAEEVLRDIINSPYHEQFVARDSSGMIIGTATISITMGAATARSAWIEQFVISPDTQGMGIGSKLWNGLLEWCREKNIHKLEFTSNPSREAAQKFYQKHGAVVWNTNFFRKTIE